MSRLLALLVLVLASFAVAIAPARAQSFSFSSASYFEGITSGNVHLDLGAGDYLDVRGMTVDPHDGALVGVGHAVVHDGGASIDDATAQFRVTLDPTSTPACWGPRSVYVSGLTIAGTSGGAPYAIATSSTSLPGAGCPLESILAEGAVGARAIRSTFARPEQRALIRRLQRSSASFGSLKSAFH